MLGQLVQRGRAAVTRLVDAVGLRSVAQEVRWRCSPSSTVRRDGRDMRAIRRIIATELASPGAFAVDVGANRGSVAALLVRAAPAGRHVLVEALPELADRLVQAFPRCEVHAVACGAEDTTSSFTRVVDRPTRSGIEPTRLPVGVRTEQFVVPVRRLDSLVGDRRPALVKIDVEGAELAVLRGAAAVLAAGPVVVFEHEDPTGATTVAIHRHLTAAGYTIADIDETAVLDEAAFVAIVQRGRVWNFVARPARGAAQGSTSDMRPSP